MRCRGRISIGFRLRPRDAAVRFRAVRRSREIIDYRTGGGTPASEPAGQGKPSLARLPLLREAPGESCVALLFAAALRSAASLVGARLPGLRAAAVLIALVAASALSWLAALSGLPAHAFAPLGSIAVLLTLLAALLILLALLAAHIALVSLTLALTALVPIDRKSTRLNSSH